MTKKSGRTKSYKERVAAGLTPVFVWLSPEAAAALEEAMSASGGTRTSVIEDLLTSRVDRRVGSSRRKADPVQGSAAELAARVRARAGGERRQAVVVATGQVAADGRVRGGR